MPIYSIIRHILESIFLTGAIAFIMSAFDIMKFIVETVLAIGTVSIAWIAYRQGKKNNDRHNELIEKINSKEHEISENLKYEVMELVATLRSIDTKAAIAQLNNVTMDFTNDIKTLTKIQASPGFIVYLHSIKDRQERNELELQIRNLIDSFLLSPKFSQNVPVIRGAVHIIMETLQKHTNLNDSMNMPYDSLLKELCSDGIFAEYDREALFRAVEKADLEMTAFLEFLIKEKHIEDPDVDYFYYYLIDNQEFIKQAIKQGAKTNVSIFEIEDRYKEAHQEFLRQYNKES